MKSFLIVPIALVLGLAAGCNESEPNAAPKDPMKTAGDAVKGATEQASAAVDGLLKDLDLENISSLDPQKLRSLGENAMNSVATQLGNIKDLASAQNVSSTLSPLLEKLEAVKTALGGKLPNVESVKNAISSLTAKFQGGEIMNAIKPMLTKLESLISGA